MTKRKHTPGPWFRNIKPASKYNTVWADRNTHVAHVERSGLTEEEIEGNINLIAAAPELLKELILTRDWLRHIRTRLDKIPYTVQLGFDQADKALSGVISKAEGGAA